MSHIHTFIQRHNFGKPGPMLAEQGSQDFGCIKDNEEFVQRAADLLQGADDEQFEDLASALELQSKDVYDVTGDQAYLAASELFGKAVKALQARMGH